MAKLTVQTHQTKRQQLSPDLIQVKKIMLMILFMEPLIMGQCLYIIGKQFYKQWDFSLSWRLFSPSYKIIIYVLTMHYTYLLNYS